VLDLETTGLSVENDRIIEVGVLFLDAQGHEQRFAGTLINPKRRIPSAASAVNGITDEMVFTAPLFSAVASSLARELSERLLVGHNIASFDVRFLRAAFSSCGVEWEPHSVIDTLKLARKLLPDLPSRKLEALCALAGIENSQAHRAEGDVRATWELLLTLGASDADDVLDLRRLALPATLKQFPAQHVARRL